MRLYHYSENPNIERFTPKAPKHHPETEPMVWAIDEWHSPLYYFPADCARVCFWPLPTSTDADLERHWHDPSLRMVIAIESRWTEALAETKIYRYTFDGASFEDCHDHGVFVSRAEEVPVSVEPLDGLVDELSRASVELRLCPCLVPIAECIKETSLHWSLIRMKFAKDWTQAAGSPTTPPLR